MIQEPFAIGSSWVHRLDPRFRVVMATVFSIVVALSNHFPVLLAAFSISVILTVLARLNLREVLKRLRVVFWFLLLIWVVLPLTFKGNSLYRVGQFTITEPGVMLSIRITIKSTTILLALMAMISTMTIVTLGHALNRLHLPEKIVHLLLMTYRYIFVIEQEYQRLLTAIRIRGFRSDTSIHSYRTFAYLIGMLFVRASTRAQRVHQAMLCRAFRGRFYTLARFKPSVRNWIFSIWMAVVIAGLIVMEINGYG